MTRQLDVVCVYAAYLAAVAFVFLGGGKDIMLPALPPALFAIIAWVGVWIIASDKGAWRLSNAPESELDEREAKSRLGAYWFAYSAFVAIIFVGLVVLTLGSDMLRIPTWDVNDVSAIVWGVFLLGLTLPTAIMIWTERAPMTDDDL
jgi:hypothetical protein